MHSANPRPLLAKGGFYEQLVELLEREGLCMVDVPQEQAMLVGEFIVDTLQKHDTLRRQYEAFKRA